jgi:hypothetical protein
MTVASDGLSVRLTRGFSLEARDADLARAISATAREHGAVDPLGHGSTFWMQELDPDKALRHAMHVDVSVAREQVEARVAVLCRQAAASSRTPMLRRPGSLPTRPETACALPPGQTDLFRHRPET